MKKALLRALLTAALGACALVCTARADCVGGAVTSTDVNLRSGAGTDTAILDTLPAGSAVIVTGEAAGGWYPVHHAGLNGYMSAEYLEFSAGMDVAASGAVSGTDVNLRSGPGTDTAIVRVTAEGEDVSVLGVSGSWYRVSVGGDAGYIRSDYVALASASGEAAVEDAPAPSGSGTGAQVAAFAQQFLGTPYVWSEESPERGFDCSGLVSYCFQSFGYQTNRTAAAIFENGVAVEKADLQPGDAVFFCSDSSSAISHVGIYIGNGKMVHASSSAGEVIITDMDASGYYTRNYVGARRIAE